MNVPLNSIDWGAVCDRCKAFKDIAISVANQQEPGSGLSYLLSHAEIVESRQRHTACILCRILLVALDEFLSSFYKAGTNLGTIQVKCRKTRYSLAIALDIPQPGMPHPMGASARRTFQIFQDYEAFGEPVEVPDSPFLSCPNIVSTTRSDTALKRISAWIDNCVKNHSLAECRLREVEYMPRRVIDVDGGQDLVRLLDSGFSVKPDLLRPAPYAALSYCWGPDKTAVIKTTNRNLEDHRRGIPIRLLPKTIQDAVFVCRGLQIRYLWVDAICILQDDNADWRHESAQMHRIYANSYVTIAAQRAASCNDGFLGDQAFGQPDWQRSFTVDLGSSLPTADQTPKDAKFHLRIGQHKDFFHEPSPLMLRGWTLQEGFLPRRIVHFTGAELAWECESEHFCECGHLRQARRLTDFTIKTAIHNLYHSFSQGQVKGLAGGGWMQLVRQYTTRRLSEPSDKLVAISGIAQSIASTMPESQVPHRSGEEDEVGKLVGDLTKEPTHSFYLAGLFRTSLIRHLLWQVKDRASRRPRSSTFRAPTWSWASVDSPVMHGSDLFGDQDSHVKIDHNETFCEPFSKEDQTGAVTSGTLTIEGLMVPVQVAIIGAGQSKLGVLRGPDGFSQNFILDTDRDSDYTPDDKAYHCWSLIKHKCAACEPPMIAFSTSRFSCLKVASFTGRLGDKNTYYLVLETPNLVGERAVWKRIGLGRNLRFRKLTYHELREIKII